MTDEQLSRAMRTILHFTSEWGVGDFRLCRIIGRESMTHRWIATTDTRGMQYSGEGSYPADAIEALATAITIPKTV